MLCEGFLILSDQDSEGLQEKWEIDNRSKGSTVLETRKHTWLTGRGNHSCTDGAPTSAQQEHGSIAWEVEDGREAEE